MPIFDHYLATGLVPTTTTVLFVVAFGNETYTYLHSPIINLY